MSEIEQRIKEKIEAVGTPLKEWDIQINYGIKTGFNEAFIVNGEKRKELIEADPKSAEIIRPLLRGRDIKRYSYEFADLYLICTFPSKSYNIDEFSAIKKFLEGFKPKLEQTGKKLTKSEIYNITEYAKSQGIEIKKKSLETSRKKTNNKWFETQDSISYWEEFSKQKIVYQELSQGSSFWLDKNAEYFVSNTGYLITGEHLYYLLTFLNSKFIEYAFRQFYSISLGEKGLRWLAQYIEKLPIIKPTKEIEQKLSKLLASNSYNEIDKLICQLYNLTDEEILFIENQ